MTNTVSTNVLLTVLFSLLIQQSGSAQLKSSRLERDEKGYPNFAYTTSVGFSLNGPVYTSEFKLTDELGLEIDVMSLMKNDSIRDQLGITDEQMKKMKAVKSELNDNLGEVIAVMSSDENQRAQVKERILGAEAILQGILGPQKTERLEQLKHQLGIEKYGLVPYLSQNSIQDQYGLSVDQKESFRQQASKLKQHFKQQLTKTNRELNEKLIKELSKSNQRRFRDLFTAETYEKFMGEPLLVGKFTKSPAANIRFFGRQKVQTIQALKDPKIASKLEIIEHQQSEIKKSIKGHQARITSKLEDISDLSSKEKAAALKKFETKSMRQFDEELNEILLTNQIKELEQIVISIECQKMGTVGVICAGKIKEALNLSEQACDNLTKVGLELHERFLAQRPKLYQDFKDSVFELFGGQSKRRIGSLLGEPSTIKLR